MEVLKNLSACLFPYGYIDTCILLRHLDNNSFEGLLENVIRNGSTLFVGESPTFLTGVLLCLFDKYIYCSTTFRLYIILPKDGECMRKGYEDMHAHFV